MMFFRGARIRHRLADVPDKRFVVSVDRGATRFFLNFQSAEDFESWYVRVPAEERTANEVVMSDFRKLFIDIDADRHDELLSMFDFERHVDSRIREVFCQLDIGDPDVIMYRMTDERGEPCDGKLSYHAVVSNFRFSARTCLGLCMIISSGQVWEACADTGVYKTVQCVRIEGSTKHGERRWKWAASNADFKSGLVSHLDGTAESGLTCVVNRTTPKNSKNFYIVPKPWFTVVDASQFKTTRSRCGTYVRLQRIKPGHCPQCDRVHDRENAVVRYVDGVPSFMCWRYLVRK
jgi:hypothetical protein